MAGKTSDNSLKGPSVGPLFQGSYGVKNATLSLHSSSYSVGNSTEEPRKPVEDTEKTIAENQEFWEESEGTDEVDLEDGVDVDIDGTQSANSDEGSKSKTANFDAVEASIQQAAQDANGSVVLGSNGGDGVVLEETQIGNFSEILDNNGTLAGQNVDANRVIEGGVADNPGDANNVTNLSNNGEVVGLLVAEEKGMELNKTTDSPGDDPQVVKEPDGSIEDCDFFDGKWVKDDHSKPYYRPGSCPYIRKPSVVIVKAICQ